MALPPMTAGGEWIQMSADRPPHYVVHPEHVKRHLAEGGRIVPDPRKDTDEGAKPAEPAEDHAALLAAALKRIEALEAQLAQKNEQSDGSTSNDGSPDSAGADDDRGPVQPDGAVQRPADSGSSRRKPR